MNSFRQNAFYLLVWRSILVALSGIVLMITRSFELATAILIGANMALLFSLALVAWAIQLTEERVVCTEAWRMMMPGERPAGVAGRRWAQNCLKELALRFAKATSVVAMAFSASALVVPSENHIRTY